MSRYGQLWEGAARVRRTLEEQLPGKLPHNYTPDDAMRVAREEATKLVARVDLLAEEWAYIEREMAKEPE